MTVTHLETIDHLDFDPAVVCDVSAPRCDHPGWAYVHSIHHCAKSDPAVLLAICRSHWDMAGVGIRCIVCGVVGSREEFLRFVRLVDGGGS